MTGARSSMRASSRRSFVIRSYQTSKPPRAQPRVRPVQPTQLEDQSHLHLISLRSMPFPIRTSLQMLQAPAKIKTPTCSSSPAILFCLHDSMAYLKRQPPYLYTDQDLTWPACAPFVPGLWPDCVLAPLCGLMALVESGRFPMALTSQAFSSLN